VSATAFSTASSESRPAGRVERLVVQLGLEDPVYPEQPHAPAQVAVADRVPVTLPVHHAIGVYLPLCLTRPPGAIAQPNPSPLAHGGGEDKKRLALGRSSGARDGDRDGFL
jgi:hypothetical protein